MKKFYVLLAFLVGAPPVVSYGDTLLTQNDPAIHCSDPSQQILIKKELRRIKMLSGAIEFNQDSIDEFNKMLEGASHRAEQSRFLVVGGAVALVMAPFLKIMTAAFVTSENTAAIAGSVAITFLAAGLGGVASAVVAIPLSDYFKFKNLNDYTVKYQTITSEFNRAHDALSKETIEAESHISLLTVAREEEFTSLQLDEAKAKDVLYRTEKQLHEHLLREAVRFCHDGNK